MSSKEWSKYRLGNIVNIKHGFAFKGEFFSDVPTDDILLTPGNFRIGGGFKGEKFKYYNGEYPEEYLLKANDVIVTMTDLSKEGDTLGYSALVPESTSKRFLHNQRLGLLQFKRDDFDKYFIYWLLRTKPYQTFIVNSASGSTVKHTSPSRIQEYEFKAPDIFTQRRIANILSTLDEKIDLNRQTNATLEEMAHTIFKEWFVEFNFPNSTGNMIESELGLIPKGWKIGKLGEIVDINMGQSPSGESYNQNGDGIIFFQGKAEFGFRFPTIDKYTTEPKKFAKAFDTLLSVRAPVGSINMASERCCIGRGLAAISGKNNSWSFAFYLLRNLEEHFNSYEGTGTVFGSINKTELENITVVIPPQEIIVEFEKIANPVDIAIFNLDQETTTLASVRDALLPKLMNGEIEV